MDKLDLTLRKYFATEVDPSLQWQDTNDYNREYGKRFKLHNLLSDKGEYDFFHFIGKNDNCLADKEYLSDEFQYSFVGNYPAADYSPMGDGTMCDRCAKPINLLNSQYFLCDPCNASFDDREELEL